VKTVTDELRDVLGAVDWGNNVTQLCAESILGEKIHKATLRLAVWSRQFEIIEGKGPAITFIREMQHAAHNVTCAIALGLYKPAAASMRSMVECALYFSYFRAHHQELATLIRVEDYFITKTNIVDYHIQHTPKFQQRQNALSLVRRLNRWYSTTSAIVHGQMPGVWSRVGGIAEFNYNAGFASASVSHFGEAAEIIDSIFLVCLGGELWRFFEPEAKRQIIHGVSGQIKSVLELDSA
jgi:hypothetical protein